ncbi:MAG: hydrogenase maturation protease [Kineosporiaceae bacterium]
MTLVLGLGSPDRGDDGAGPAVVDQVRALRLPGVRVRVVGDPSRLLEAWSGEPDVVVVDAVRADDEPAGTVLAIELGRHVRTPAPMPTGSGGTHTLGLTDAVRLARALDALPRRLLVVGIVGRTFTLGAGLSDPVRAAVESAAAVVASRGGSRADAGR